MDGQLKGAPKTFFFSTFFKNKGRPLAPYHRKQLCLLRMITLCSYFIGVLLWSQARWSVRIAGAPMFTIALSSQCRHKLDYWITQTDWMERLNTVERRRKGREGGRVRQPRRQPERDAGKRQAQERDADDTWRDR